MVKTKLKISFQGKTHEVLRDLQGNTYMALMTEATAYIKGLNENRPYDDRYVLLSLTPTTPLVPGSLGPIR